MKRPPAVWLVVVLLLAGGCSRERAGQDEAQPLPPPEWAETFARSATRLRTVLEGSPSVDEHRRRCAAAAADLDRERPRLTAVADDELDRAAEQWAAATDDFYELCVDDPAELRRRGVGPLDRVGAATSAINRRLVELGIEPVR